MTEQFKNNAESTLAAAMTTTTWPFCVVSSAATFPTTGTFRIKIDNEILIVTAVSGTTFTVTHGAEGTTPATHASGTTVYHLLTKGSLEARIANRFITDLYANKPAAGIKGRIFFPRDGLFIEYDDGSNWHKYGPYCRLKPPPQTGWTWVNRGYNITNPTVTFTPNGALILEDPNLDAAATVDLRILVRPVQSLPATLTVGFLWNGVAATAAPAMGLVARSSGGTEDGQFTTISVGPYQGNPPQIWQKRETCYATPNLVESGGQAARQVDSSPMRLFWFRMSLVGSYKYNYCSADGVNWILTSSTNLYTNSTPNQWGIFIDPTNNDQKVSMSVVSWEES